MRKASLYAFVMVATLIFAVVAILAHMTPFFFFDVPTTQLLQSHRTSILDLVMTAASWPGYAPQFALMFGLIVAVFLALKLRLEAAIMTGALLGVGAMGFLLKPLVGRTRPSDSLVWVNDHLTKDPYTFTAGHAHTYVVVYGWIIFLAVTRMRTRPGLKWLVVGASLLVLLLTGVSRVYLGDHWASDVLAGYLLGAIWLALEILVYMRLKDSRPRRERSRAPAAAAAKT
jgi:membrane-associated phospholipid phosphatase